MEDRQLRNHLELLTTEDLQKELCGRFDHLIFYGVKHRPLSENPNLHLVSVYHSGDIYKCIGLASRMIDNCHKVLDEISEDVHADDL